MGGGYAYLDVGDVTLLREIHPIGFVQFRTDDIVQILNTIVFSNQGR
jgi:hypothetical protein